MQIGELLVRLYRLEFSIRTTSASEGLPTCSTNAEVLRVETGDWCVKVSLKIVCSFPLLYDVLLLAYVSELLRLILLTSHTVIVDGDLLVALQLTWLGHGELEANLSPLLILLPSHFGSDSGAPRL